MSIPATQNAETNCVERWKQIRRAQQHMKIFSSQKNILPHHQSRKYQMVVPGYIYYGVIYIKRYFYLKVHATTTEQFIMLEIRLILPTAVTRVIAHPMECHVLKCFVVCFTQLCSNQVGILCCISSHYKVCYFFQ